MPVITNKANFVPVTSLVTNSGSWGSSTNCRNWEITFNHSSNFINSYMHTYTSQICFLVSQLHSYV